MKNSKGVIIFIVKLLISVGLLGYLVTRIDAETLSPHAGFSGLFLYRLGVAGLSFDSNGERDEVDGSDPAAGHQDAVQRAGSLLFYRHVF